MQDFIVEIDGRRFIDIVKILPEKTGENGKPILWEDLKNGTVNVFVRKFGIRGGNAKPMIMRRFVPVCSLLFEGLGLWLGDGIKRQGGLKVFGFANTEMELHKHFLTFSEHCLGIFPEKFHTRISVPPELWNQIKNIEREVSDELKIPLENFWKPQILVQRNKANIDIKISSRILSLIINDLFIRVKCLLKSNRTFIASFLKGLIASEGNVNVRRCGRLGEIMIALHDKQTRVWIRKLLQILGIKPNKDKEILGDEGILIHGFSNFKILQDWELCSLHPLKNLSFKKGINGFEEEQFRKGVGKLLVLKELSVEPKTSFELARHIQRTAFMARVHLRDLHRMGFIRKKKIIGRKIIWEISELGKKLLSSHNPIEKLKNLQNL